MESSSQGKSWKSDLKFDKPVVGVDPDELVGGGDGRVGRVVAGHRKLFGRTCSCNVAKTIITLQGASIEDSI